MAMTDKKRRGVIQQLVDTNDHKYQLLKASEEAGELSVSLLQYVNKKGRKTTEQDVIDEIGDVEIRLEILKEVFGRDRVNKRVADKLEKFNRYLKDDKYIGGI